MSLCLDLRSLSPPPQVNTPRRLVAPNGGAVSAIALGYYHSAFEADGRWYVMGKNDRGQLGLDTFELYAPTPRLLAAPNGARIARVALGGDHTAFVAGGQCFVVGGNAFGQLGLGHQRDQNGPVHLTIEGKEVRDAVLGGAHSAFQTADGQWYVAGRNDKGQLGLVHTIDQYTPQPVTVLGVTQVALPPLDPLQTPGHPPPGTPPSTHCFAMERDSPQPPTPPPSGAGPPPLAIFESAPFTPNSMGGRPTPPSTLGGFPPRG